MLEVLDAVGVGAVGVGEPPRVAARLVACEQRAAVFVDEVAVFVVLAGAGHVGEELGGVGGALAVGDDEVGVLDQRVAHRQPAAFLDGRERLRRPPRSDLHVAATLDQRAALRSLQRAGLVNQRQRGDNDVRRAELAGRRRERGEDVGDDLRPGGGVCLEVDREMHGRAVHQQPVQVDRLHVRVGEQDGSAVALDQPCGAVGRPAQRRGLI